MASKDESSGAREPQGERWVERWILPALRDTALLPVVLVVAGHVVAFTAPMLIFALRDRKVGAQLALLGLLALTIGCTRFEIRTRGRPGLLSGWVGGTWLAALATAWVCHRYALF